MRKRPAFDEFAVVNLVHAIDVAGLHLPGGTRGVVMAAYADGLAYEVEIEKPVHMVLTLHEADIRSEADAPV